MKSLYKLVLYGSLVLASAALAIVPNCNEECKRENNCACASTTSPLSHDDTPQFVTLTFDDAVSKTFYNDYLSELFANRFNPDSTPITATFYVPHPYTDYRVVNDLYKKGHDISLNSVSKGTVDYWKTATEKELRVEFGNNRRIIQKFSNITSREIVGIRTPHLQLAGDTTFTAYRKIGLQYDSSWVTHYNNPLFPFTLDYASNQECLVGTCPTQSHPGIWVLPIINLLGIYNAECNALAACQIEGSAEQIANWLVEHFNRMYYRNKAPITLMVNSAWFQMVENSFEGLKLFLDYLQPINNVYLVSHREVLNWSKNPIPVGSYKTNYKKKSRPCATSNPCNYKFGVEERILSVCGKCPSEYPWLGNPEGN